MNVECVYPHTVYGIVCLESQSSRKAVRHNTNGRNFSLSAFRFRKKSAQAFTRANRIRRMSVAVPRTAYALVDQPRFSTVVFVMSCETRSSYKFRPLVTCTLLWMLAIFHCYVNTMSNGHKGTWNLDWANDDCQTRAVIGNSLRCKLF